LVDCFVSNIVTEVTDICVGGDVFDAVHSDIHGFVSDDSFDNSFDDFFSRFADDADSLVEDVSSLETQ
jgi:hypothetical protein